VPALVTDAGGPQFIVKNGETGYVCRNNTAFVDGILALRRSPEELARMRSAARKYAEGASWDAIFDGVYRAYEEALLPSASVRVGLGKKLPAGV
jgi:phosphatidylinositol alpha 1,6-mannosyltransferase